MASCAAEQLNVPNMSIKFLLQVNENFYSIFKALKTGHERIDFVNSYLTKIPDFNVIMDKRWSGKSNEMSSKFRMEGNDYFRVKNHEKALEGYTKSVAYAEQGSAHLALAYGNRSAVLFEKRYFRLCLQDIERALVNDVPEKCKNKLLIRQKKAKLLAGTPAKIGNYYSPVPLLPPTNIEIKRSQQFGCHIVASRDINTGEIISAEDPFAHRIHPTSQFLHCHYCLDLCYNLIPCDNCPGALYCKETCKENAFLRYHKYECSFLPWEGKLLDDSFYDSMSLNITIRGIIECNKRSTNTDSNSFQQFEKIKNLCLNEDNMDIQNIIILTVLACLDFHFLKKHQIKFFEDFAIKQDTVKDILYQCAFVSNTNCFRVCKIGNFDKNLRKQTVANAVFCFSRLYNHSCAPNAHFYFHGSRLIVRAVTPIKKGEQCMISYGHDMHFAIADIYMRKSWLKLFLHFDCQCKACLNKWPTFPFLPKGEYIPEFEIKEILYLITLCVEKNEINKGIERLITIQKTLKMYEPSQNIVTLQATILEAFKYLGNKILSF